MLAYQIRLAFRSIRRNPILSTLIVCGIGLGIGVSMTFITGHHMMSADPLPEKSDRLFVVQIDAWNPDRPWWSDRPDEPPNMLTYRDATGAMASDIPTYRSAIYPAEVTVYPGSDDLRPYREIARLCRGDFFRMFEPPFRFGSAWDDAADAGPEPVVVIDAETNQRLFGGEDSVGRLLRIDHRDFRVVGVLDRWKPLIKYYDPLGSEFAAPEAIYLPFAFSREMELYSYGTSSGWKSYSGKTFEDFVDSELIWLQAWVQLDSEEQKDAYLSFLDAYALEQKALGRHGRPVNNKLRDLMGYLRLEEVVPEEVKALVIISFVFLIVSSVNLIGILLGKFLARSPEISVRRALGATRRWIFVQHLIECELIGLLGGLLGLLLSVLFMYVAGRLFDPPMEIDSDLTMVGVGIVLALVAGLVAGIYPAWRVCHIDPGVHLKSQ
jgi:putative ABC transport system permease protein